MFDTSKKAQHTAGAMPKPAVDYIVLHRTEGHVGGDLSVLTTGGGRSVSANFYVTLAGHVYQMVPWDIGANHAGYGTSGLAAKFGNANHNAYGIELEGLHSEAYPDAQMVALDTVIAAIDAHLGRKVPITTHAAIDPGRKDDPYHFPFLAQYNKCRKHDCAPAAAKPFVPIPDAGLGAIYRLSSPSGWFYTDKVAEANAVKKAGAHYDGVVFMLIPGRNTVPLYRFFNPKSGQHLWSTNPAEVVSPWLREGVAFNVSSAGSPVYRFTHGAGHFYTTNKAEGEAAKLTFEGVVFTVN